MKFLKDDRGATGIEYALLAGLLAIATLAAVQMLQVEVNQNFTEVSDAFSS